MPWRKYLLITLTKKSSIFKLFTSPISLFPLHNFVCSFHLFLHPHAAVSICVIWDWGQLLVTIISPAGHEGRHNAAPEAGHHVTRCHEPISDIIGLVTLLTLSVKRWKLFPRILERNYLLWRGRNQSSGDTDTVFPCIVYHEEGSPCIHYILVPWGSWGGHTT